MMVNWIAAYNRLYRLLDGLTGSQFISIVQETDPDLDNYSDFIRKRQYSLLSTTKRDYFKDILLERNYADTVKHHLFETFLIKFEKQFPNEVGEIRSILKGENVIIRATGIKREEIDDVLLTGILASLKDYDTSYNIYCRSINDLKSGKNERHILDDLRLSLECFLKQYFSNEKSLENQISNLGSLLKENGVSSEISSTFIKLIELYSKYQNNYVKHNDIVKKSEIEFIVNVTNSFYRFLLHLKYKN